MFWKKNPGAQSSWSALRRLPYLSACINEGLRLGTGSMKRSPRVFAQDETPYKDWVIPRKVRASDSREPSKFCPCWKLSRLPFLWQPTICTWIPSSSRSRKSLIQSDGSTRTLRVKFIHTSSRLQKVRVHAWEWSKGSIDWFHKRLDWRGTVPVSHWCNYISQYRSYINQGVQNLSFLNLTRTMLGLFTDTYFLSLDWILQGLKCWFIVHPMLAK